MSAPRRLLEDPATAEALRADLTAATTHQVAYDMSAGLARFEANLAQVSASGSSLKPMITKLGVVGVVGGVALGVALWRTSAPPVPAVPQVPAAKVQPQRVPAERPKLEAPVATAPSEPAVPADSAEPETSATAAASPARPRASQAPAPVTRDDLLAREVEQLRLIRQTVGSNPARALSLANTGHVEFRRGVLHQEREALALQALNALGRRSELERRGDRYLKAYPNGSFSARVRQMLGRE